MGSTLPVNVISPVMPRFSRTGSLQKEREERGDHRNPGRRTIFWGRSFRNMDMDLRFFEKRESAGAYVPHALHISPSDLRRLLHHIAGLACQLHLRLLGRVFHRFDVERCAAHRCPGKTLHTPTGVDFVIPVARKDRFAQIFRTNSFRDNHLFEVFPFCPCPLTIFNGHFPHDFFDHSSPTSGLPLPAHIR